MNVVRVGGTATGDPVSGVVTAASCGDAKFISLPTANVPFESLCALISRFIQVIFYKAEIHLGKAVFSIRGKLDFRQNATSGEGEGKEGGRERGRRTQCILKLKF